MATSDTPVTAPTPDPGPDRQPGQEHRTRRPLVLAPFRGLRFAADRVGDLGTVVSPPYDVLDADTVRELESANRHNIVRLILSRRFERPYRAVRERLQDWRDGGYLVADPEPALYLYQYAAGDVTVRGLIGALALREEQERVVLPHEDVMPGPVEDRTVLMRTTETNLEPILLVHRGSPRLRDLLEESAGTAPLVDFTALDGSHHRLWAVTDRTALDSVAAELAGGQALIADGHHRYAAYLGLQHSQRSARAGAGALDVPVDPGTATDSAAQDTDSPWDYGLAMLVDQHDYPLGVGPIHRSVTSLTLADVQDVAAARGDSFTGCADRESAFTLRDARAADPGQAVFVLSDGRSWAVLGTERTSEVDAAVLHDTLFEAWHVTEAQVGYHHSIDQAQHTTARQPGIVVAVAAPTLDQVMAAAAAGIRMPRKSTSFFPKPRMGLVMRDLRDA